MTNGDHDQDAMSVEVALYLIDKAREGSKQAERAVLFPFQKGEKFDETTGKMRRYTKQEIKDIKKRLIG